MQINARIVKVWSFPEFTRFCQIGIGLPKVNLTCEHCGSPFSVFPAFIRHAEKRGGKVRFCSRSCTDAARSAGILPSKKKTGEEVMCAVCGTKTYRPKSRLREGRVYVCSEPCRLKAHEKAMIDRSQPRPKRKLGKEVTCPFCGTVTYRKKSMIERNVDKTCGEPACMSAYGRSLWGLKPHTPEKARLRKGPARRRTNFTAKNRKEWLGDKCAICDATENLCLDHIIPVCAGGNSSFENAQTLCQPCNVEKVREDRLLALAFKQFQSGGCLS